MFIRMLNLLLLNFLNILNNELSDIFHFIENIDCFTFQNAFSNDNCRKIDNIEIYTKIEVFRESWLKKRDFCCYRVTFINCEFCYWQYFVSIILMMITKCTNITFYFLINNVWLIIDLKMKSSWNLWNNI